MSPKKLNFVILGISIVLVGLALYLIATIWLAAGKFRWVDPDAVADGDEIYGMPISVAIASLGIFNCFYCLLLLRNQKANTASVKLLFIASRVCSLLYALFITGLAVLVLSIVIPKLISDGLGSGDGLFIALFLLLIFTMGLQGILVIKQVFGGRNT